MLPAQSLDLSNLNLPAFRLYPSWSEPGKLDHFWPKFCAVESRLGREDDEGLEVFRHPEGVYSEGGQCRRAVAETIWLGLPRRATIAVGSRATRRPEIDVSGMAPVIPW
jgi:hypothetical protein